MAAFMKITDSEMNYFQFKARQLLLLKKEDEEWQEFYLSQADPDCTACSVKERDVTVESKTVGIQVSSKKPLAGLGKKSVQLEHRDDRLPQALHDISVKLESIDLALSKMYDVPKKKEKDEDKSLPLNERLNVQAVKSLEEQRKYLIQKSLQASLQKINNSTPRKPKQIVVKNSSYFLPHDLQQKRAVARKAYLASLQNPKLKLKVAKNVKQGSKKDVPSNKTRKDLPKVPIKSKRKTSSKPDIQKSEVNKGKMEEESTLIGAIEGDEQKDENIEYAVDGILDDLLREAVVDLNRIKHMNKGIQSDSSHLGKVAENKGHPVPEDLVKTQATTTFLKGVDDNSESLQKIKLFLGSTKAPQQKSAENKKYSAHCRNYFHTEDLGQLLKESDLEKPFQSETRPKTIFEINDPPKFVCDVSKIISVDSNKVQEITLQKDRFWRYLNNISRTIKGNFNPWLFCNMIAESILDDCIKDVAAELGNVPSALVNDLYDKEFMQQVESSRRK